MASSRLSARHLFDYAFYNIINAAQGVAFKTESFVSDNHKYGACFHFDDIKVLLFSPVSDLEYNAEGKNEGATPITQAIAWWKQVRAEYKTDCLMLIPLGECRGYLRQHWTLLVIQQNDEGILYDPKWLSFPYSLQYIQDQLSSQSINLKYENITYYNWQGIWDLTSCGYFVGSIVGNVVKKNIMNAVELLETPLATDLEKDYLNCKVTDNPYYQCMTSDHIKFLRGEACQYDANHPLVQSILNEPQSEDGVDHECNEVKESSVTEFSLFRPIYVDDLVRDLELIDKCEQKHHIQ